MICTGVPVCDKCGAATAEGVLQQCPSTMTAEMLERIKLLLSNPQRNEDSVIVTHQSEISAFDCDHIGDPTSDSAKLKGCGCGAFTTVFECELFQLCARIPITINAEIIERTDVKLCLHCEHNPANQSAPTAT